MGKMSMKAMKMASAMKMRKMKAKKVSKVGKKWQVFKGSKVRTTGGNKKEDLKKNKKGKVVSKKLSAHGKKQHAKNLSKWSAACAKARKTKNIKGFVPIGWKTAQGQAFLKAVRSFYRA